MSKAKVNSAEKISKSKASKTTVEYVMDQAEPALSTISSKNQITLPAHLVRELGLSAGDRLAVSVEDDRLVLRPRPKDWVKHHGGSLRACTARPRRRWTPTSANYAMKATERRSRRA